MDRRPSLWRELLSELKRRRVPQVLVGYLIIAWLAIQVAVNTFDPLGLPTGSKRLVILLAVFGLPVTLVVAWAFDITPEGVRRTRGREGADGEPPPIRRATRVLGLLLGAVLVAVFAWGALRLWNRAGATGAPEARAAVTTETPTYDPTHLAVLYLDDLSPAHDLGYLAGGLTEELIHRLDGVEGLKVSSTNAVRRFKGRDAPVDSIRRELDVGSVVRGSVQRSGDLYRVTVQLVDAKSGATLATKQVEEPRSDLFTLEDEVADSVARALRTRLGIEVRKLRERKETHSVEAWTMLQRAREVEDDARKLAAAGDTAGAHRTYRRSDSLLASAANADPSWARVPVERGWVAWKLGTMSRDKTHADRVLLRRALTDAARALRLDTASAPALELRGKVLFDLSSTTRGAEADSLVRRAEADLRTVTTRDPSRARAWSYLSDVLHTLGRQPEADVAAQHALAADAFLENASGILKTEAQNALQRQDFEVALGLVRRGEQQFPQDVGFPATELVTYAGQGAPLVSADSAWALMRSLVKLGGQGAAATGYFLVAGVLARHGLADSALAVVSRTRASGASDYYADEYEANVRLLLGQKQRALDLIASALKAAPQKRDLFAHDWWWRSLHGDPSFQSIVKGGATGP